MRIFVYGSLLNDSLRYRVLDRDSKLTMITLSGFEITEHSLLPYPSIKKNKNSVVEGGWFEVSEQDLEALDRYETQLYEKHTVLLDDNKPSLVYVDKNYQINVSSAH